MLTCQRYIELNPVRASMEKQPALFRFCCYRSKPRQAAYRDLFKSELDFDVINDIKQAITQNQPLGNSRRLNEDRSHDGAKA
ncbi:MAG: hypothetical protein VSS75_007130 [Candidatus Parabeggiatoa sp.]|nr:hypothetical protein [Candidatus Parabeggiatoa sp.]